MIRPTVSNRAAHFGMLQIRNVAGDAAAARRLGAMMRVFLEPIALARMTARALPVVSATGQRRTVHVAIALRVRIVTVRASHASLAVALAEALRLLVRKGPHTAIGREGAIAEQWKSERVEALQRIAGEIAGPHLILEGVALIADAE